MSNVTVSHFLFSDMFVHTIESGGRNIQVFDKNRNMMADPGEDIFFYDDETSAKLSGDDLNLIRAFANLYIPNSKVTIDSLLSELPGKLRSQSWGSKALAKNFCADGMQSNNNGINGKDIGEGGDFYGIVDFNKDGLTDYLGIHIKNIRPQLDELGIVISAGKYIETKRNSRFGYAGGFFDPCFATAKPGDRNYKDYLKQFDAAPAPKGKTTSPKGVSI